MNKTETDNRDCMTHFGRLCNFGGRLCGTPAESNALEYVRNFLDSLTVGILKTHDVEYDGWVSNKVRININKTDYSAVALPGCGSLHENGVELELVDCGRGTPDELQHLSEKIKGRVVLVSHEYMFAPDHVHRSRKLEMASSLGAAALVISNPWDDSDLVSGDASSDMPAFGVSKKTGDALRCAARRGDNINFSLNCSKHRCSTQTLDWFVPPVHCDHTVNEKEIIICAHIDGHDVSQSAMDNASGVAVALALAAQFARSPLHSTSLRILIFSAEERGLIGSENYVRSLTRAQKQKIQAVLNLDCVGGSTKLCAMISESDYLRKVVRESSEICKIAVNIFEPTVPNSDHYNFAIAGIPALRLIAGFGEKDSKLRHVLTSADNHEQVTPQELNNSLKVVQSMVACMA